MKPWKGLSFFRKATFVGCVALFIVAEKIVLLLNESEKAYNLVREEKLRKERMN